MGGDITITLAFLCSNLLHQDNSQDIMKISSKKVLVEHSYHIASSAESWRAAPAVYPLIKLIDGSNRPLVQSTNEALIPEKH